MPVQEDAICTICRGAGEVVLDDLHVRKCLCVRRRAMRAHLGDELFDAPRIKSSPLYGRGMGPDGKVIDLTGQNLYISASSWTGLLPHIRLALIHQGTTFYFRILTDEMIKRCYVGAMAYKAKRQEEREATPSYNGLGDMVAGPNLLILKLGWIGHGNRAAAGAIHETLLIREDLRLPTWLVSTDQHQWQGGHSHSLQVESYVAEQKYRQIQISSHQPDLPVEDPSYESGMSVDRHVMEEAPSEERVFIPIHQERSDESDLNSQASMSILSPSGSDFKKRKKRF